MTGIHWLFIKLFLIRWGNRCFLLWQAVLKYTFSSLSTCTLLTPPHNLRTMCSRSDKTMETVIFPFKLSLTLIDWPLYGNKHITSYDLCNCSGWILFIYFLLQTKAVFFWCVLIEFPPLIYYWSGARIFAGKCCIINVMLSSVTTASS